MVGCQNDCIRKRREKIFFLKLKKAKKDSTTACPNHTPQPRSQNPSLRPLPCLLQMSCHPTLPGVGKTPATLEFESIQALYEALQNRGAILTLSWAFKCKYSTMLAPLHPRPGKMIIDGEFGGYTTKWRCVWDIPSCLPHPPQISRHLDRHWVLSHQQSQYMVTGPLSA